MCHSFRGDARTPTQADVKVTGRRRVSLAARAYHPSFPPCQPTHKDVNQACGNFPMAWNEERKLFLPPERHRYAKIGQRDTAHRDALLRILAEAVLDFGTDGPVPIGQIVVRYVEHNATLAHEHRFPGAVQQQQQMLLVERHSCH